MRILTLGSIEDKDSASVGGKARGLDSLIKAGFNVAPGFVLVDIDPNSDLKKASDVFLQSGFNKVAVRSSATAEDGIDFSFAGQFKTFLNISSTEEVETAVCECINSLEHGPGKIYADHFIKKNGIKMNVVIQKMVEAEFSGVCFTDDPFNSDNLLIEAVEGLGEGLVSGLESAVQYSIPHDTAEKNNLSGYDEISKEKKLLNPQTLQKICKQAMEIQSAFGMAIDTEWAICNDVIYWLQARPITVKEDCAIDEFDFNGDLDKHLITRCNIGEMLPGAVTPLTISASVRAIDWGMREMMRVAGAGKRIDDIPEFAGTFSIQGHLFMDLSMISQITNTTLLSNPDNITLSVCGRCYHDEDWAILGKKKCFLTRLINTIKYLNFVLSGKSASKKLDKIAKEFAIQGYASADQLYQAIDKSLMQANLAARHHYVTSAHSGVFSSAILQILNEKFNDFEKSKAVLAGMLERIDDIESVDILAALRRIALAIISDNPNANKLNTDELTEYIKNAKGNVCEEIQSFYARHGHRAIREAEMRSSGWKNDTRSFIDYLSTVLNGKPEHEQQTPPDIDAIIAENGFKKSKAKAIKFLSKLARKGVRDREYSKSKLILILDIFKTAYRELAKMLVSDGKLPDEDAIFFLTHKEIGEMVNCHNATLVKKALQRRSLLKYQSTLRFSEMYIGKPKPLEIPDTDDAGDIFKGTPISRGIATGPARIIKNVEDASKLVKGEIMVAVFTDIGWSPYYCLIEGLVTEIGSALSHGGVVAREYALPFVSNVVGATSIIKTGDIITVNGTTGVITRQSAN